ncbi:MAG: hypothetical protein WDN04_28055 [Rhodospirillales bacterium]
MQADAIWQGGGIATMVPELGRYGAIEDGAVATGNGRIVWVGRRTDLPAALIGPATIHHDIDRGWLTPGLIDCHTHLVFAGDRSAEFEARLGGISYQDAAKSGRGILSTMAATRAATEAELIAIAGPRLQRLLADGVTTVEIKSGYGLSLSDELKMLRAARALGAAHGVRVRTTLLAAHAYRPNSPAAPTPISTTSSTKFCPPPPPPASPTPSMRSPKPSRLARPGQPRFQCRPRPRPAGQTARRQLADGNGAALARLPPRALSRSSRIHLARRRARHGGGPQRSRCCCPAPTPPSAPRSRRRWHPSAPITSPWPSPPMPTPAVPRCSACSPP